MKATAHLAELERRGSALRPQFRIVCLSCGWTSEWCNASGIAWQSYDIHRTEDA